MMVMSFGFWLYNYKWKNSFDKSQNECSKTRSRIWKIQTVCFINNTYILLLLEDVRNSLFLKENVYYVYTTLKDTRF